jgi:hypothetical protein
MDRTCEMFTADQTGIQAMVEALRKKGVIH